MFDKLLEACFRVDEGSLKGTTAILKVYRAIERGLDPSVEDIEEGLTLFLDYLEPWVADWKANPLDSKDFWFASEETVRDTIKRYTTRLKEVAAALGPKATAGEKIIALDNVIDLVHNDMNALEHMDTDPEDTEDVSALANIGAIVSLLRKLGKFPGAVPAVDVEGFMVYQDGKVSARDVFHTKKLAAAFMSKQKKKFPKSKFRIENIKYTGVEKTKSTSKKAPADKSYVEVAMKHIKKVAIQDENGFWNSENNVHISNLYLTEFPVKFGVIKGDFYCSNNLLTSLKGAPQEVGGYFSCRYNKLTSLEGAPQKVGGNMGFRDNKLITLEGAPQEVGGELQVHGNTKSVEELAKTVDRPYDIVV